MSKYGDVISMGQYDMEDTTSDNICGNCDSGEPIKARGVCVRYFTAAFAEIIGFSNFSD